MGANPMRYGVLGSLEVSNDGVPIEVTGGKQRALLAILLLNANRVVSNDRLIDALWDEDPPDTARKALQVLVSQLRKLVGKERLQTRPPGYVLIVEQDELDLMRFQDLQREGRTDEALSLWRGPFLSEFADHPFAWDEIARMEELRLACVEERIDRDLAAGRAAELVAELESLVKEHPVREQFRRQLMLALYRTGRQAEALDTYQSARATLVDELGIEPSRSLRELHQAILNQDPTLDLSADETPVRAAPELPTPVPELVVGNLRKTITAMLVEVAIASRRGEALDPEALRRVTGQAFGEIEAAVERHSGTVETLTAETLTAIFGLPLVHEDDALRGVRSAAEIRAVLTSLATELAAERAIRLDFRIGISTGEVVTGGTGGPRARTTGEPLQLAAQLVRVAEPGEILFDHSAHQLVRVAVTAEPAGNAWRLVHCVGSGPTLTRRLASPMVGRERERRRLQDAFETAASNRSCQLFTVLGVAGVGKSRLVQEFLGDIAGRALVGRGRCLPYGRGITFWPLLEVVKDVVSLDDSSSPDEARAKLIGALGDDPGSELVAQRVAETIGLAEIDSGAEERFTAVRGLFAGLARTEPVVIVFDDIHWAEPTFLDLIEHLVDWTRDAPLLLVCLARPELLEVRPGWGGGKLDATTATLVPLSGEECAQLIANLVGQPGLTEVGARIAHAAEGNPLFVEEMFAMLIDDGQLVREGSEWVAKSDVSDVRVPPTIQALLAARLDQLGATERSVIERAAIVGKEFQEAAILELAPERFRPAVVGALEALTRKELIRRERGSPVGDRTYCFRHLLIRDAAYDSIPKETRAELHERFGLWLESSVGERAVEVEEFVGYHLEQAYHYRVELGAVDDDARAVAREAAEQLGRAGRRAFIRSDAPAGANLVMRATALLPPEEYLRVELVPNVRAVQGTSLDMSWADRVLTEAVEAAATNGDRRLAAHALVQRGLLRLFTEPNVTPDELIDSAERSAAVFAELQDDLGLARAWRLKAQAYYLGGRAGSCAEASERALRHAQRAGDRYEEREIVEWLVIALMLGPSTATDATRRCESLLEEIVGQRVLQTQVLGALATLLAMQGRLGEAAQVRERGRTIVPEVGELVWIVSFWWATIPLWENDPIAAERELRPGYAALKELGSKSHLSSFAHLLSNALYAQGRYDEADELARECEDASRPNDVHSRILARTMRAKVLARRGQFEAARKLASEAVEYASRSDFHPGHAEALMDLAEILNLAGEPVAASAATEEAIHFYELKGNRLAADRARASLRSVAVTT